LPYIICFTDNKVTPYLIFNTIEKTNFSSPEPVRQKLFMDILLPVTVLIPTDMTGAVTTKYENQHPVKLQTSSFSYKIALIKLNNLNNR